MKKINLLITSVGRRAYIVQYFKKYMRSEDTIHVSNSQVMSAFKEADFSVITPLIKDDGYIDFLLDYCQRNRINALLSLFDLDLVVLSKHKLKFDAINVELLISSDTVIETCHDKWRTYQFLTSYGFKTPLTYLDVEDVNRAIGNNLIHFPIVIKPRFGSSSIGVYEANDLEDLYFYTKKLDQLVNKSIIILGIVDKLEKQIIFQEKINGIEYNLDIMNDLNSVHQATVVKRKLEVRAGETDRALILKVENLKKLGLNLSQVLKHRLDCDCDIIVDNKQEAYIIDLNPRFGGGYPFSHTAGVNLPRAILSWLKNEKIDYEWKEEKDGIVMQKEITIQVLND